MTDTAAHLAGHLVSGGTPAASAGHLVRTEQHRHPETYSRLLGLPKPGPGEMLEATEVLSLVVHAVDNGAWDELAVLLTPDAEYAVADETATGVPEILALLRRRSSATSHHTVNAIVRKDGRDLVAWSRLVSIAGDGSVATADSLDRLVHRDGGWRVARRQVQVRHGGPIPGQLDLRGAGR